MQQGVYVSAPGRVCLGGEKLDWMGGSVITCALESLRVYVAAHRQPAGEPSHIVSRHPFNTIDGFALENLAAEDVSEGPLPFVRAACHTLRAAGYPVAGVAMEIKTTLPAAAGLSSSAAVTVAVLGALNALFRLELTPERVCHLAYQAEATYLRTGCGQMDQYACGLGGVLWIDCGAVPPREMQRRTAPDDLMLVIGDTGAKHHSGANIRTMRQRVVDGEPLAREYMARTQAAVDAMLAHAGHMWDREAVGGLVTDCHTYARDYAQTSTPALDACVEAAIRAGAYGAKLSGSGHGGCMFALTDATHADTVAAAITAAGGVAHVTPIARHGLRIEGGAAFARL